MEVAVDRWQQLMIPPSREDTAASIIDPITLSLIASGISAGVAGAGGVAGGLGTLLSPEKKRQKELMAQRETELAKLTERLRTGAGFGLDPYEAELLFASQIEPVRAMSAEQRARNEALLAATGVTGGADVSRLRTEAGRIAAEGSRRAGQAVGAADIATRAQERATAEQEKLRLQQEIENRQAVIQQINKAGAESVLKGLGGAASIAAQGLGEATTLRSLSDLPPEQAEALTERLASNPASARAIDKILQERRATPLEEALDALPAGAGPYYVPPSNEAFIEQLLGPQLAAGEAAAAMAPTDALINGLLALPPEEFDRLLATLTNLRGGGGGNVQP